MNIVSVLKIDYANRFIEVYSNYKFGFFIANAKVYLIHILHIKLSYNLFLAYDLFNCFQIIAYITHILTMFLGCC